MSNMITKFITFCVVITMVSGKMDPVCKMDAPLGVDPENCCKVPDFLDHQTLEKCAILVFKNDTTDISSEIVNKLSGQCLFECIFREHEIFKNNEVLIDEALKLLKEVIEAEPEWMPIVSNAIATCKTIATKMPSRTMEAGTCSPLPAFYFGCFHTQLFKVICLGTWKQMVFQGYLFENIETNGKMLFVIQCFAQNNNRNTYNMPLEVSLYAPYATLEN